MIHTRKTLRPSSILPVLVLVTACGQGATGDQPHDGGDDAGVADGGTESCETATECVPACAGRPCGDDGCGDIFLYESGDSWGSMWAYEARGCSTGIVHNLRTASSSYKGIRRDSI